MRAREFINKQQGVAEENNTHLQLSSTSPRAQEWIKKVYDKFPSTWQNYHVMSWGEGEDQQFAMFELVPSMSKRDAVEIKWFQAYPLRQGVGSRAMRVLQDLAQQDGISLTLYPWDKGQVSQNKLMKFYRGLGFKPTTKGSKNMVWQGVAEGVQNFNIGYHVTKKQNVPSIMKNGLRGGNTSGFTLGGEWADAIYGKRPVYIALDKGLYKDIETTELKIDLRGFRLVPDLPSLIDLGAMVSNNNSIYWKHDEDIPKLLMDYAEDGEIFYDDLLKNENVIRAAILSTRTAAILDSIPANKISTEFYKKGVSEHSEKNYLSQITNQLTENRITLQDLYNGNFPERDELFWDYVRSGDLHTSLEVKTLPKHKLEIKLKDQYRVEHLDEIVDMMNKYQKDILHRYMNDPNLVKKIIVISGNRIIDGNHRALAAAMKGVSIQYVDLADLDEQDMSEAWSEKYKRSINCDNPKGFSQRAHCQGRKKK